jgi:hypothetical protein
MLALLKNAGRGSLPDWPGDRLALCAAPHVRASLHDGGVVWIDLHRGKVFSSNRAGAMIWTGVVERWSLDRVVDGISREFAISAEAARGDAVEYLTQLVVQGLLIQGAD